MSRVIAIASLACGLTLSACSSVSWMPSMPSMDWGSGSGSQMSLSVESEVEIRANRGPSQIEIERGIGRPLGRFGSVINDIAAFAKRLRPFVGEFVLRVLVVGHGSLHPQNHWTRTSLKSTASMRAG